MAGQCVFVLPWGRRADGSYHSEVLLYMGTDGPLYAFSLFLPSIINQVSDMSVHYCHEVSDVHIASSSDTMLRPQIS